MRALHIMLRVQDLKESLHFYINILGMVETRRVEHEKGRATLVFLGTDRDNECLELTFNWDNEAPYSVGRNFGHISFEVSNIYDFCQKLLDTGINLIRPPKDGCIAFIRSPDNVPIEIVQEGKPLPKKEPWASMTNDSKEMYLIER